MQCWHSPACKHSRARQTYNIPCSASMCMFVHPSPPFPLRLRRCYVHSHTHVRARTCAHTHTLMDQPSHSMLCSTSVRAAMHPSSPGLLRPAQMHTHSHTHTVTHIYGTQSHVRVHIYVHGQADSMPCSASVCTVCAPLISLGHF